MGGKDKHTQHGVAVATTRAGAGNRGIRHIAACNMCVGLCVCVKVCAARKVCVVVQPWKSTA